MDTNELAKFKRNSAQGKSVSIGDGTFYFKPLPLKKLPELLMLSEIFQREKEDAMKKKENIELLLGLLDDFVINSYPDLDKETRNDFVLANMFILQESMVEISSAMGNNLTNSQKEQIEKIKELQQAK